jgi:hypothetical protein
LALSSHWNITKQRDRSLTAFLSFA